MSYTVFYNSNLEISEIFCFFLDKSVSMEVDGMDLVVKVFKRGDNSEGESKVSRTRSKLSISSSNPTVDQLKTSILSQHPNLSSHRIGTFTATVMLLRFVWYLWVVHFAPHVYETFLRVLRYVG